MDSNLAVNGKGLNTEPNRESLIVAFPKLRDDRNFAIESPATPIYNCIAFAMGTQDVWVDASSTAWAWWPENVSRGDTPAALTQAFEALSFECCSNDAPEKNFDKVALYSKDGKWTHAAKILGSGVVYHSKFGQSFDATHSGDSFAGSVYGDVFQFMKRPVELRSKTTDAVQSAKGTIEVALPIMGRTVRLVRHKGRFYMPDGSPINPVRKQGEIEMTPKA